jgi:hypothetical protein
VCCGVVTWGWSLSATAGGVQVLVMLHQQRFPSFCQPQNATRSKCYSGSIHSVIAIKSLYFKASLQFSS